ncbi:MAG: SusC/RagA family TonB-linked outer membrane protein [Arcticibacter sp.]
MQNFDKAGLAMPFQTFSRSTITHLIGVLILLLPLYAKSQSPSSVNTTLKGQVIDDLTNTTLPGVTVHIKGTTHRVQTDQNGRFEFLTGQKLPYSLELSYIGFESKTQLVEHSPVIIRLKESRVTLNDVVVVGYGTQNRKDLIGSVTKVNAEDVKQIPAGSFDAQLQGKAPGLQINSNTGIPGEGIFIRVRGTTSINASNNPLYVVDGVFMNNNSLQTVSTGGKATSPIADLNPSDIESIEVLKDASATAIYGARGANGVVIITTKKGSYNTKPKVSFNSYWGVAKTQNTWDIASGQLNAQLHNESWINSGIDNPALKQTYANRPFRPISEGGRGVPEEQQTYDRLSDIFQTAPLQNYDLSLQGGSEGTRYYIGGGYTRQEATMRPVYFERASLKLNLEQKVNKSIRAGVNNSISRSFRNQARAGDGPQGGMFQTGLLVATYLPKVNADGTPAKWGPWDNLDVLLNNYDVNTANVRYIGNVYLDADILPGLKFRSSFGIDYNDYKESEYWNSLTLLGAAPTNGLATSAVTNNNTWLNEQTLSYRKTINNAHTFGILIGNSLQGDVTSLTSAQGTNFPNDNFKNIASAAIRVGSENWTKNKLTSFFSRVDYNYNGKYYIEGSIRADGSSRFGSENRFGYFPSVGAAWRLKEENFLKNVNAVSDLKLKGSYGLTGNQNGINDFAARGLWNGGQSYPDNETSGDKPGIAPAQLANPNLKWEKTRQVNGGVELGLSNNRISLEANVYHKYTSDLLVQLPLASTTGFSSYYSNEGEVSNRGYEFSINTLNIKSDNFQWRTNFNISGNKNKIEKLVTPINVYNRDWLRMEQGHPLYSFWLYKQLYVDPANGNAVFEDVNKDGQITVADRQLIGNAMPDFFGGLNNSISYKGWDASVLFTFQYGNEVYNLNEFFDMAGGTRADRVLFANSARRWQQPGDITDVPRFTTVGNNYRLEQNSRLLEDGSFIRLKMLSLGYTLPEKALSRLKMNNLRIFVSGSNLLLFTKYSGLDPESNVASDQNVQGLDFGTPPQPSTYQFGINLTL